MENNQWTMNCVIFGAKLFRKLHQGRIAEENAIDEIRGLTSALTEEEVLYLFKRIQHLVVPA